MKKQALALITLAMSVALAFSLVGCGSNNDNSSTENTESSSATEQPESEENSASSNSSEQAAEEENSSYTKTASGKYASGKHTAVVKVKGYDEFTIELDADEAPVTVSNFAKLAKDGYYDGLAFYRVVDGFCLQGGTKGNTASGNDSSLTPILGEFSDNNVDNKLADSFEKGTVAMARTSEVNSATSTFFITLDSSSSVSASLDGQYAAFGTIDNAGMKVIDKIVSDCKDAQTDSMGVLASEDDMPIISSIKITK